MDINTPNGKGKTVRDYLPMAMQRLLGRTNPSTASGPPSLSGTATGMRSGTASLSGTANDVGSGHHFLRGTANDVGSGTAYLKETANGMGNGTTFQNGFQPSLLRRAFGIGNGASSVELERSFFTPIDKKAIQKAISTLKKYKDGKRRFEERIVEEERWYKLQHWDVIRRDKDINPNDPEPTSAWLFNSLSAKHADTMDNYPEPNVLPREASDEQSAKIISSILPVIFERNNYEETYSDAMWYKLKHGVTAKGVFWNNELEDGIGDVDVKFIDMLNVFWQPGITDIQSSRNLFIVSLMDNDLLEQEYPQLKNKVGSKLIDVTKYVYEDDVDVSDKSVVVDWYYKKRNSAGKVILHFCKFVGNEVLFASENEPQYAESGFYNHGKYPIEFDVLFPDEGTPIGFGYIAIMQSPQLYIDKLKQAILKNVIQTTKMRYYKKKNVGIDEKEFLDLSKDIVEVEGSIDEEHLRRIETQQIGGNILNVLQMTIDELKETSSNRDFSQGSTASGVTSGAAISALQEAGNKQSRDMITASYRSYKKECYLVIELMRQFYDDIRSFRIIGDKGKYEFVEFNNRLMQGQQIPPYPGQEDYTPIYKKPVYDIIVKPQKRSPYSKMAQNELAKEMYNMGFFNPEFAEQAMTAFELMDFDGMEMVKERVQSGQTLLRQLQQMAERVRFLENAIGVNGGQMPDGGTARPPTAESGGRESAEKQAMESNMTAYGERLAKRAKPNMDND